MSDTPTIRNNAAFIWSVADLLRGDYKQSEYGRVILPLVVLRRLDCVLEGTKAQVLERHKALAGRIENIEPVLEQVSGQQFFNVSPLDFRRLLDDPANIADNLRAYIAGFSSAARDIIEKFDLGTHITKLDRSNLLFLVVSKFAEIDLHPEVVSHIEMGYLYEELVRRFSELSNETAGEHFTPRDVVELVVSLLFKGDEGRLRTPTAEPVKVFDPVCGTGGLLTLSARYLEQFAPERAVELYGQELNLPTAALCRAELLMNGNDATGIAVGNTLIEDGHPDEVFEYMVAHPPFGLEWRSVETVVRLEAETSGHDGRFGAGTPPVNDGSLLFLQHMISKMRSPEAGGSRIAVLFNGSPMFSGAAGSGEASIRRWLVQNDWLEAVVAMPDQLLFNTGISTYLWIVTNRKAAERRGVVQLINARQHFTTMRKSVGDKRKEIGDSDRAAVLREYPVGEGSRMFSCEELLAEASASTRIEPWMFDTGISSTTHIRLHELVSLLRPESVTSPLPLLDGRALERPLTSADQLDRESEAGRRHVVCCAGDIVGNGKRWLVLSPGFGSAATNLEVLRPHSNRPVEPHLLALWLSSDECAQQLVGSTLSRLRGDIMVPRALVANARLAGAAQEVAEMRAEARRLLENLLEDPFRRDIEEDSPETRLLSQASAARAIRSLLLPLDDAVHRAEWQYPYQVAKAARDYRLAVLIDRRLDAALLLAESLVRTIGLFAGTALCREGSHSSEVMSEFEGGISMGSWLQIVQLAQKTEVLGVHPEVRAISFKKRGLGDILHQLVGIRNRVRHSATLLSNAERQDKVAELNGLLTDALDQTAWLGLYEMVWVESCQFTGTGFSIQGLRLNGSHPDWEAVTEGSANAVHPGRVYLRTPRTGLLDLSPFAAIASCSTCRREELYVLDRVQSSKGTLASARDHRIEVQL